MFSIGEKVTYNGKNRGTIHSIEGKTITVEDSLSLKLVAVHASNVRKENKYKKYKGFTNHAVARIEERLPGKSIEEFREDMSNAVEIKKRDKKDRKGKLLYNEEKKLVMVVNRHDKLITTYRENLSKSKAPQKRSYLKEDLEDYKELEIAANLEHKLKKSYKNQK